MFVHRPEYVIHRIARIAGAKREQWQPVHGAEWPDRHRVPDHRRSGGAPTVVPA
jgi:hypothetical protein